MATVNQIEFLKKLGYTADPSTLTIQEATGLIDRLKLQADDAKRAALQNADIVQMAGQRVELRKNSRKQHAGPCPKCGGDDRFYCEKSYFACRQCHPKRGDAIEYISWIDNLPYADALAKLGGPLPITPAIDKVKPVAKAPVQDRGWNEQQKRQLVIDAHLSLLKGTAKQAQAAMTYLQNRCIDIETIKAFDIGYAAKYLPHTWEDGRFTYPRQVAITLPWFNHDGALISIKYRFIEKHDYTDLDGKARTGENKTSEWGNQEHGNLFGWQQLQGPNNRQVLIICEGEMNALSLWKVGNHVIDVLSAGPQGQIINLPAAAVDLAKQYKHVIVWADERDIADKAAKQIGAAAMESPKSAEYPKGADANDMLKAGALFDWLTFAMGQLGVEVPPLPPVAPTPSHDPAYSSTLMIKDAQPFDFKFDSDDSPNQVTALAEQLRQIAQLTSFDERLDALEPLHATIGAMSYTDVRDPSIVQELQKIFKKQSAVDAFLSKYGAKEAAPTISFEPEPVAPMATQADYDAHKDDLTSFVGMDVTDSAMGVLTGRAMAYGWKYGTSRTADGWHIHRLVAY